jgi:2'-5' RNA ligase
VPYAVTLRLGAAAAAPIEAMWRALAAAGLHDDALALGYPPHLTLAIQPDTVDPARLRDAAARCAATWSTEPLRFAGFGLFVAPEPVLFLAPVVTDALLVRHAALATMLADLPGDPHYRPGAWVPHVTLAKGGAAAEPGWMGRALDCLAPFWPAVLPAAPDRVELVKFRPVTVLADFPINGGLALPAGRV